MYIDQAIRWKLIERNMPPPPASVFEVGCGDGALLERLGQKGYDARGCELDISYHSRHEVLRNLVVQASGTDIPLPDNSVDCTISSDVLEHVEPSDRMRFVQEMIRITKRGGLIVFTVWVRPTFSFRLMGCIYLLSWGRLPGWYIEHTAIRPPRPSEIADLLQTGATILKVRPYQASLGHIVGALQPALCTHSSRLCRLTTALSRLVSSLDFVGVKSSRLFVARKLA
jgi:SAM-dependent methyltransferase